MSLTLAELAAAKGLTVELLASFGVTEGQQKSEPHVRIPYRYPNGQVAVTKLRLKLADGPGRFHWPKGKETMPYGLERLANAPADAVVIYVEGESDVWTLSSQGFTALGIPGAKTWKPGYGKLRPARTPYVWQEPDEGGAALVKAITHDRPDARVIVAPSAELKDPNALYQSDPAGFADAMRALMTAARSPQQEQEAARAAAATEALSGAGELLDESNILDRVEEYITASGYAGDTRAPKTVYVSLTSRCLRRPLNLALIAPSAAGKNAAVDAPLPLFAPTAYVVVKAGSPRALIYGEQDFAQRIVIVSEADSIPEDGPPASAVRALAADNQLAYDVVERDEETGKWGVRHIVRPGPTGLITTSTKPLKEQLSTRMLTVGIPDSRRQTRSVLHAHADAVNGRRPPPPAEQFVAAQQYLEIAGVREVFIPFAHALADAVPDELVRMRRDFRQLLTVIEALAFLHQRSRARDAAGRVVAMLDDYSTARDLVVDVFTAAATGGVSQAVREVVTAVQELTPGAPDGVTCMTVATRIGLHKNTTWYRLKVALKLGLVVNSETRRGHPAKLRPGDDLPEDGEALPTVERLAALTSAYPPETTRTVEPLSENPHQDASGAVQVTVQVPVEPFVEPLPSASALTIQGAVQRFNGNPGGIEADGQLEHEMVRAALDSGLAAFTCPSTRGCQSVDYWIRADGEPMCAKCHPDPQADAAAWERRRADGEAPMN